MSFPRLHIAFIAHKFGHQYGGAEAYGVELMRELAKRHDITVIAHEYDSQCNLELPFISIQVPSYLPSWIQTYLSAKQAARITAAGQYDLVHSHVNGWNADVDILHVKSVRYRWVTQCQSLIKKINNHLSPRVQSYLWLEKNRVHLKPPRRTAVVSESLKSQLQKAYNTKYPFDVLTPGVHLATPNPELRSKTRLDLGLAPTDTLCLLIARDPNKKGLQTILTALTQLPKTIKLAVVGAPEPLGQQLQSQLQQQQLTERVLLIPQCTDVTPYYKAADICLHPTFNDSFGMAPLEAMSHQIPVIMSNATWCGFAHYATHNENALLLSDPHNALELQQALERLVNDATLQAHLTKNAYDLAARFSWENIAKQVESIYVDILAARIHQGKPDHRA